MPVSRVNAPVTKIVSPNYIPEQIFIVTEVSAKTSVLQIPANACIFIRGACEQTFCRHLTVIPSVILQRSRDRACHTRCFIKGKISGSVIGSPLSYFVDSVVSSYLYRRNPRRYSAIGCPKRIAPHDDLHRSRHGPYSHSLVNVRTYRPQGVVEVGLSEGQAVVAARVTQVQRRAKILTFTQEVGLVHRTLQSKTLRCSVARPQLNLSGVSFFSPRYRRS